MSPYHRIPQTSPAKPALDGGAEDDLLESLQNIPSNFDLALNCSVIQTDVPPKPTKTLEASLLDPEAFRRLSVSSISSFEQSRGVSPFPSTVSNGPRTWRNAFKDFWSRNQGLLLVSFSQLFGALMNVTTRLLELEGEGMHPFQILFARMSLTLIFCCTWMYWKRVPDFPLGAKGIRLLLVGRGLSGFFGIYGLYYSLQYLPVADAIVLTFLAPSVASYACYLFLKEPFPRSAQYASLVSLLGVVLIARPTSLFSSSTPIINDLVSPISTNTTIPTNGYESSFPIPTSAQRLSAVAVAMLGVLGTAGAFTSIRWIGSRAHPLLSVNYFAVFCTSVSFLALSLSKPLHLSTTLAFALPNGLRQWAMLLFLGVCGFVMQFLLTKGLAAGGRGNGARATNFIYTNMLFALALDKLVFGQSPGWWSLGGSGLILASAVFVAMQKQQDSGRAVDEFRGRSGEVGVEEEEMGFLSGGEAADGVAAVEDEADEESRHIPG